MDINFEYYKIFYYVAKYKSFSKAAEKLLITQPAISQTIRKLEEQLGTKVFYRNREGITLTEEGKKLYNLTENAIIILENTNKKFEQFVNLETGTIKIRTGNTIAREILYKPLIEFMKLYPNIRFEITNGSNRESMKWLNRGEIDIVLMNLPYNNEYSNIEIRECKEKEFVFVMSRKYQMKYNVEIKEFNDLQKYHLILPTKISSVRKTLEKIYEEAKYINNETQISSEDIKVELVKNDCGIILIEKNLVKKEIEEGKLIKIDLPKKIIINIGISTLNRESISFATKKLVEMIEKSIENAE